MFIEKGFKMPEAVTLIVGKCFYLKRFQGDFFFGVGG